MPSGVFTGSARCGDANLVLSMAQAREGRLVAMKPPGWIGSDGFGDGMDLGMGSGGLWRAGARAALRA